MARKLRFLHNTTQPSIEVVHNPVTQPNMRIPGRAFADRDDIVVTEEVELNEEIITEETEEDEYFDYHDLWQRYKLLIVGIFGLSVGLLIAWYIWPVEWTSATPAHLSTYHLTEYVDTASENLSVTGNEAKAIRNMEGWATPEMLCSLITPEMELTKRIRISYITYVATGEMCNVPK